MAESTKVALVTGASRGIGKAIARHLARAGFDVAICARTVKEGTEFEHSSTVKQSNTRPLPGSLESTAREIEAAGRRALQVKLDLNEKKDMENAVRQTVETFGRIDVLVNNGRYVGPGHMDPFLDLPIEAMERHLACNVIAPMYLTQLVVPIMSKQGGGRVINLTSGAAFTENDALPGQGSAGIAYSVSKAGTHRIAMGLAKELRPHNISITNLDPGYTTTERIIADMAEFGFTATGGLSVDVPAAAATYLATCADPMAYTGEMVIAAEIVQEKALPV